MDHYFHDNKHLKSNRKEFSFRFWCLEYLFMSDHGVFAKDGIDMGSRVLLEATKLVSLEDSILDLGCGYGTIGIIIKKVNPQLEVTMVDVNARAVELAKENASLNKVAVTIVTSNMFENIETRMFHSILINPPIHAGKSVVYEMFKQSYEHLYDGGQMLVVMRKSHGAKSAKQFINEQFGNCEIIMKSHGFYILCAKRVKID